MEKYDFSNILADSNIDMIMKNTILVNKYKLTRNVSEFKPLIYNDDVDFMMFDIDDESDQLLILDKIHGDLILNNYKRFSEFIFDTYDDNYKFELTPENFYKHKKYIDRIKKSLIYHDRSREMVSKYKKILNDYINKYSK